MPVTGTRTSAGRHGHTPGRPSSTAHPRSGSPPWIEPNAQRARTQRWPERSRHAALEVVRRHLSRTGHPRSAVHRVSPLAAPHRWRPRRSSSRELARSRIRGTGVWSVLPGAAERIEAAHHIDEDVSVVTEGAADSAHPAGASPSGAPYWFDAGRRMPSSRRREFGSIIVCPAARSAQQTPSREPTWRRDPVGL